MILTPFLKPGDTIGIVACARKVKREELAPAIKLFESWELKVVFGKNLFNEDNQFSGTDDERAQDLQSMLDNPEVKAIISARGGYGTMRIIDKIKWSGFVKNRKWICGFSDITVLHSHVHSHFDIPTLHSIMPITIPTSTPEAIESFRRALFGEKLKYNYVNADHELLQRNGNAKGQLVGGNLSLLYALNGSRSDIDTYGKILFIEDLDEYLYHIDRMMISLKRAGKLKHLKGLIVGGMSDMRDNTIPFGKTAEQIIAEAVGEYNYPVCFDFSCGHIKDNRTLILGAEVELEVRGANVNISFN